MKIWQKTISSIAAFALLVNSLAAPFTVLAQEATPSPEPTPAVEVEVIESEISTIPETTATPTQEPAPTQSPIIENTILPTPSPEAETSTPSPSATLNTESPKPSEWTFENVELNKEYESVGVKVIFTKLPKGSGNIKISEITLSDEQVVEIGALSNKAYDIISNMEDGTFEYTLSLPLPENADGELEVKFAESVDELSAAQVAGDASVEDGLVIVNSLNHFTIFYTTNNENQGKNWAHVNQLSKTIGSTVLEFVSTRNFLSCFEYRTDGDTSQKISDTNHNTVVTDGLYPYTCVQNEVKTKTISANEYVEVRMVFGAEGDERFDWTRFDVLSVPSAPDGLVIKRDSTNAAVTNTTVNDTAHSLYWNAVASKPADLSYRVRVTPPVGEAVSFRTNATGFDLDRGASYAGIFGTQQGQYKFEVRIDGYDYQGLTNWSNPVYLIYDSAAPTITSITANGIPLALDGSTEVSATSGITFQVEVSDPAGQGWTYVELNDGPSSFGWLAANTQGFSTTLATVAGLYINGEVYGLKICPNDKLGNGVCTQVNFTIDNTAPVMDLRYGQSGPVIPSGSVVNNTDKNIRVAKDAKDVIFVTRPSGATSSYAYDGTGKGYWSADWLFTQEGKYSFYVKDAAGNVSPDYTITIDNTSPIGSWANPNDGDTVSGSVALNFNATDAISDIDTVEYEYKATSSGTFIPTSNIWDTTSLPLGYYDLKATATDMAGNTLVDVITVGVSAIIVSEPQSGIAGTDFMTIVWTTDRPTSSKVVYDTIPHGAADESLLNYGYALSATGDGYPNHVFKHSVTITGLTSGTTYYYRTISEGSPATVSEQEYFRTFSASGAPPPSDVSGVLGLSTETVSVALRPVLAYVSEETKGSSDEEKILGEETNIETEPISLDLDDAKSPVKNIALIVAGVALVTGAGFYLSKRKKGI